MKDRVIGWLKVAGICLLVGAVLYGCGVIFVEDQKQHNWEVKCQLDGHRVVTDVGLNSYCYEINSDVLVREYHG